MLLLEPRFPGLENIIKTNLATLNVLDDLPLYLVRTISLKTPCERGR